MATIATKDIYEIVTNTIIRKLEEGTVPWRQPWTDMGLPRNLVTRRPYRGVNLLLLAAHNYPSNEFVTFRQVQDLGGRVNKGEKAHLVVLWLWVDEEDARRKQDVRPRRRPLLRYYHVFNITQCTGLYIPRMEQSSNASPIAKCEDILNGMPKRPRIVHNENEAYYHPVADYINMPKMESFESAELYYTVLMHELVHSTGYEDRLNRKELMEYATFGSETYSIEELTAEIGSCYLATLAGLPASGLDNSAAYIQGWLGKLRNDKRFIVYASAQAQKAVDYILNVRHDENDFADHINANSLASTNAGS